MEADVSYILTFLAGFFSALALVYAVVRLIWWYDTRPERWEGL